MYLQRTNSLKLITKSWPVINSTINSWKYYYTKVQIILTLLDMCWLNLIGVIVHLPSKNHKNWNSSNITSIPVFVVLLLINFSFSVLCFLDCCTWVFFSKAFSVCRRFVIWHFSLYLSLLVHILNSDLAKRLIHFPKCFWCFLSSI